MKIVDFLGKIKRTKTAVNNVKKKHKLTSTEIVIMGVAGLAVIGAVAYLISKNKIGTQEKEEKKLDQRQQMLELEATL